MSKGGWQERGSLLFMLIAACHVKKEVGLLFTQTAVIVRGCGRGQFQLVRD